VTTLGYDRYCSEIVTQTALLTSAVKGADLTTPVPSCPDWNLGQLLRHLGGGHRWAETIVRTRATQPPPDDELRNLPTENATKEDLTPWLTDGANNLAESLRTAGPTAEVWTPTPGGTPFLARRFTHETLIHRADATLAIGAKFTVDPPIALDALDEWMELGSLPQMFEIHPEKRELLGEGRTLHLHSTDAPGEWLVDLTGEQPTWRRGHEKAAVAVRGPLTDLLLMVYGRKSPDTNEFEVLGEKPLLDFWLKRVTFG
jgi:uncharacterized protein (TIGR03083 family)